MPTRGYVLAICLLSALLLIPTPGRAQATVTVSIVQPSVGNPIRFGQTLLVRATVTSTNEVSTVTASVGGRSIALIFNTGAWVGTITTGDLPYGAMTLTVVATDVNGVSGQAQRSVFHDNPPTLEFLSPAFNALARPDIRVHARCTDDGGPCQLRTVGGGVALTGTGEIDGVISLALLEGREVHYEIVATDSAGQSTGTWRPVWVESSRRLGLVATLPGLILDIDSTRALVLDEFVPRRALIVDRLTGAAQAIYTEPSPTTSTISSGFLTPVGALVHTRTPGQAGRLHEWRNGALTEIATLASIESLTVAGGWAIYSTIDNATQPLVRRNLLTGVDVTISTTALNNGNDVTASGDVVYAEPAGVNDFDLYRYSGGSSSPLVVEPAVSTYYPKTDGAITAFARNANGIGLHTPNAVETLTSGLSSFASAEDYRVNNGWTAFVRPGNGGSQQVWTRSPAGTLRQVSAVGGLADLENLNPNGDVVYRVFTGGGRRYLAPASGGPTVEIGSTLGRPVWLDNLWHVLAGPHLLRFMNTWNSTLAEGATGPFFDTDLAILNPYASAASVLFTFIREDGSTIERDKTIGPNSHLTVHVDEEDGRLASAAFSTVFPNSATSPVVVERTMTWDATGYGGHSGSAVDGPRMKWHFAEGAQGYFDTYILLVNTGATAATARLTFLVEGGAPVVRTVATPSFARVTVYAGAIPELVNRSFSTIVEATAPIVAERAMYFGGPPLWAGGHESAGVPDAATRWYHAEGASGPMFDTFILLANPNPQPTQAYIRFLTDAGVAVGGGLTLPAFSRLTIPAEAFDPQLANASFATTVQADLPIVSERAMYWSTTGGAWQEAHNSFGVTATATKWATADGRVGGAREYQTYVLVANPSETQTATITATFMREGGVQVARTLTLGPNRRLNIFCNEIPELVNANFGVVVQSTNGVPIAVERATYWNAGGVTWAGGTNVTATPIP
jgi:Bacterial Ig domain